LVFHALDSNWRDQVAVGATVKSLVSVLQMALKEERVVRRLPHSLLGAKAEENSNGWTSKGP
jgi:hypothetical protein